MNAARVEAARRYLGVPFVHQGRLPTGMDCAGLLVLVFADEGRALRDLSHYGRTPWKDGLEGALLDNFGDALLPQGAQLEPGDVVLITNRPGGPARHIAIVSDYYLGGLALIHTRSDISHGQEKGRVTEHRMDERWSARVTKAFRP